VRSHATVMRAPHVCKCIRCWIGVGYKHGVARVTMSSLLLFAGSKVEDDQGHFHTCPASGACDAMCGFCQGPVQQNITLGKNISVPITTADDANTPHYSYLRAEQGKAYRVRAYPDLTNEIRGMVLIIADPSGKPIRRAASQTGAELSELEELAQLKDGNPVPFRRLTRDEALEMGPRDTWGGCEGNSHIDLVFKAEMSGLYKVGLGQATDSVQPRSAFGTNQSVWPFPVGLSADEQFQAQSRAPFKLSDTDYYLDFGYTGGTSTFGAPKNGALTLLVTEAVLPPLDAGEQQAMLDLKSKERGVDVPDYLFNASDHPCTWGSAAGIAVRCCLREDASGQIVKANITHVSTDFFTSGYSGQRAVTEFKGTLPDSLGVWHIS
jgi:hypothetical protein